MEQFSVTPVEPMRKKPGKKSIVLIIVVVMLVAGLIAAVGYFAFQNSVAQSKVTQLSAAVAQRDTDIAKLKNEARANIAGEQASQEAPQNAASLMQVLLRLQQHPVDLTSEDEATVFELAKQHYKADTLPEGAAIVIAYEMIKPQTPSSGEKRVLVYWPKTSEESAEFIDVIKAAGSNAWRVDANY